VKIKMSTQESQEIKDKIILDVTNLSKHFEGLKAVDEISFSIKSGELIGIIGPNGAGKTTLFNILTGFLRPDGGKIIFNDKDITGNSPYKNVKEGLARTFQRARPFKMLDALNNTKIAHIPKNMFSKPSTLKNKATWSLITVDLAGKKNYPAFILPHGDLKRLDFARSIGVEPKLLLLDEPFAGLSLEEAFRVERAIKEASEKGMTIIIVEHKLQILMKLVERVLVIHQGKLLTEGAPVEVVKNQEVINAYLGTEVH
jgi:branched-chain amino acid transport system ATP-binding protein